MGGVIPEPTAATARGSLQMVDSIDARDGFTSALSAAADSVVPLPPGFLEDFAEKHQGEVLEQVS